MSIALNPELEERISLRMKAGFYQSPSEVIEAGLELLEARDAAVQDKSATNLLPLWEEIALISKQIPDEEWEKIPSDGSINVDHYLYGSPKVSE